MCSKKLPLLALLAFIALPSYAHGEETLARACSQGEIQALLKQARHSATYHQCNAGEQVYSDLMDCYNRGSRQAKLALDEPLRELEDFLMSCARERWKKRHP